MKTTVLALAALGILAFIPSAAQASACPGEPPSSQVFLDYGDDGLYFLSPGGDFESGAPGWALADGAALTAGPASGSVLSLTEGASAVSPPICVAPGYKTARLLGQGIDSARRDTATVQVEVLAGGVPMTDRTKTVRVTDDWAPTRAFRLGDRQFVLDPGTLTGTIQLRLTALGPATALLDDLYVDPSARR